MGGSVFALGLCEDSTTLTRTPAIQLRAVCVYLSEAAGQAADRQLTRFLHRLAVRSEQRRNSAISFQDWSCLCSESAGFVWI